MNENGFGNLWMQWRDSLRIESAVRSGRHSLDQCAGPPSAAAFRPVSSIRPQLAERARTDKEETAGAQAKPSTCERRHPHIQAPFSSQGLNPYTYAFNSPHNWVDPSGFEEEASDADSGDPTFSYPTEGGTVSVWVPDIAAAPMEATWTDMQSSIGESIVQQPPPGGGYSDYALVSLDWAPSTQNESGGAGSHGIAPNDPLSDRSRFASMWYAITRALYEARENPARFRDAALAARDFWRVPTNVQVFYDALLADEEGRPAYGATDWEHKTSGAITITIGPLGVQNPAVLFSTMAHEGGPRGSHRTQIPNNWAQSGPEFQYQWARAVNELEAFRAERSMSAALGLSQSEIGVLDANIQALESKISGTRYAGPAASGIYLLDAADKILNGKVME
jgi:hypothetical protein